MHGKYFESEYAPKLNLEQLNPNSMVACGSGSNQQLWKHEEVTEYSFIHVYDSDSDSDPQFFASEFMK
ncbi:hypothetical protein P8452_22574 [Trifolium repens]|nr:hypothetical protein P8452_22574 [Trifolium repens]